MAYYFDRGIIKDCFVAIPKNLAVECRMELMNAPARIARRRGTVACDRYVRNEEDSADESDQMNVELRAQPAIDDLNAQALPQEDDAAEFKWNDIAELADSDTCSSSSGDIYEYLSDGDGAGSIFDDEDFFGRSAGSSHQISSELTEASAPQMESIAADSAELMESTPQTILKRRHSMAFGDLDQPADAIVSPVSAALVESTPRSILKRRYSIAACALNDPTDTILSLPSADPNQSIMRHPRSVTIVLHDGSIVSPGAQIINGKPKPRASPERKDYGIGIEADYQTPFAG